MNMAARPRVFSIPPSAPFLPTLVSVIMDGSLVPGFAPGADPLALARATIYLPTRRACRLARAAFLEACGRDAVLLPRLRPLGDIDEDELAFADVLAGPLASEALDLPLAIAGAERRLLLAQLIRKWAASPELHGYARTPLVAATPDAALHLADGLARLIDDMITRGVPWDRLDGLVPESLDGYWQLTLRFLKVAREAWPALLAERGAIEPAERRDRLLEAEAARLVARDAGPVIAAGSTGSMPAAADLLATIARLPQGALVLPGLDLELDDAAWDAIPGAMEEAGPAAGHPQFAMHGLLRGLRVHRTEVQVLGPPSRPARERLVSEATRPAAVSHTWHDAAQRHDRAAALDGMSLVEAANAEEEALAIAVAVREALERDQRVALTTPDRALAKRVAAALARWNIAAEDTGGEALADSPAGVFARLAAEAALEGLQPVTLLALLKHADCGLDGTPARRAVSTLERAVLRGPRPAAGSAGLAHALRSLRESRASAMQHPADPRMRLRDDDLGRADALVAQLAAALRPLEDVRGPCALPDLVARHREVLAALASDAAGGRDDVEALAAWFEEVAQSEAARSFMIEPQDYPDALRAMLDAVVVRRQSAGAARVRIFGLLEARLQMADRVVLAGLNEGTWPPQTRSDPWLSRPMRQQLGLDLPERRIGLSAHDFVQALGAPDVVLTRAAKVGGAPTVASRFVQRLAAVAGEEAWQQVCGRGARIVRLARKLDAPADEPRPVPRPEPRPPLAARPRGLSVTEIEHWLRDPYTIYAKHVLRLTPLNAVDTPPGARDRGSAIHEAIGEFTERYADALPDDSEAALIAIGEKTFAPLRSFPETQAFWWPRFLRIAKWFAEWERQRRAGVAAVFAESAGVLEIVAAGQIFKLRARADRIERLADGRYAILDYKTGQVASSKQVASGLTPQLTLEAAILKAGGFEAVGEAAGAIAGFAYVQIKGGEPPGRECVIDLEGGTPDDCAAKALAGLTKVAAKFADPQTPYRSLVHPMWKNRYGDYDHLARVKEWSLTGGELDPDMPA